MISSILFAHVIYLGAPLPAVQPEFARDLYPEVAKSSPSITRFQYADRCDRCCDMLKEND